jgi:hypothetical protein
MLTPDALDALMKKTTNYHEAGHAAAVAFYGPPEWTERMRIRIRLTPGRRIAGNVRWGTNAAPPVLSGVVCMAGTIAEMKANDFLHGGPDFLAWYYFSPDKNWKRKDCDFHAALCAAQTIQDGQETLAEVIATLQRWTAELLDLPDVWACVESCARRLAAAGGMNAADMNKTFAPILGMGRTLPRWEARFKIEAAHV